MPSPVTLPTALDRLLSDLTEELTSLETDQLRRRLTSVEAINGPLARISGRELVCWCSNDYLGLSSHPALATAAAQAAAAFGIGARASRLLAGTTEWHARLETSLAGWYGTEAAAVFPSGYLANLGTLRALLCSDDAVFMDRAAHASLVEAVRGTGARFRVFPHNDVARLDELLVQAPRARRRLIVTEGVFSMDGDQAPLAALVDSAKRHEAVVYLDDAHGAFVTGATGRGSPEMAGVTQEHLLYMATLGKALGCQGGFVTGPRVLIDYLHNRARTFIYATALAVPVAAAAAEALRVLAAEPEHRRRLADRVQRLHGRLAAFGLIPDRQPSHIIPVIVGDTARAQELSHKLWVRGLWAPAIRPPTVPKGTARLRVSVTALHTDEHIDALAAALREELSGRAPAARRW